MLLITTSKPILLLALALAAVAVTSGARNNPGKHLARRGPQAATAPPPPKTGGPGRKRSPQTATAPPKTGGPGPGGRRKRNPHDTTGTPPDSSSDPNFSDFDDVPPSRRANPNPTSESPSSSRRAPQDEEEEYEDEDVDQPETETEDDPPDSQSQPTVETETIEDNVPRGLTQISPRWLPRAPQDSEPIEDVNPPDAQPQAPPELEEPVPETDGEDPAVVRSLTQISPRWLPRSPQDTDVDGDTQGGDASTPGPDTSESDGGESKTS